jgi:hypothetical protein
LIDCTGNCFAASREGAIDSLSAFDEEFTMANGALSSLVAATLALAGKAATAPGTARETGLSASAAPMQSKHITARTSALIIPLPVNMILKE